MQTIFTPIQREPCSIVWSKNIKEQTCLCMIGLWSGSIILVPKLPSTWIYVAVHNVYHQFTENVSVEMFSELYGRVQP